MLLVFFCCFQLPSCMVRAVLWIAGSFSTQKGLGSILQFLPCLRSECRSRGGCRICDVFLHGVTPESHSWSGEHSQISARDISSNFPLRHHMSERSFRSVRCREYSPTVGLPYLQRFQRFRGPKGSCGQSDHKSLSSVSCSG